MNRKQAEGQSPGQREQVGQVGCEGPSGDFRPEALNKTGSGRPGSRGLMQGGLKGDRRLWAETAQPVRMGRSPQSQVQPSN